MPPGCAADSSGASTCRCLNTTSVMALINGAGITHANIMGHGTFTAFSAGAVYPSDYGIGCGMHDLHLEPYCKPTWGNSGEYLPRWCAESWCWVDETSCEGVPAPTLTSYFAPLQLKYSYVSCNGTNTFTSFYTTANAPRPPPTPPPQSPPTPPPDPPPPPDYSTLVASSVGGGVGGLICLLLLVRERTRGQRLAKTRELEREFERAIGDAARRAPRWGQSDAEEDRHRTEQIDRDRCAFFFVRANYLRQLGRERTRAAPIPESASKRSAPGAKVVLSVDSAASDEAGALEALGGDAEALGGEPSQPLPAERALLEKQSSFLGRLKASVRSSSSSARLQDGRPVAADIFERWLMSGGRLLSRPLPRFQELCGLEHSPIERLMLDKRDCVGHLYRRHILAVSHRWDDPDEPDPNGEQLRRIVKYVCDHPEITYVWYDHWCMPQGSRTKPEEEAFEHMLKNINFLFLGCRVLILQALSRTLALTSCPFALSPSRPLALSPSHRKPSFFSQD